MLIDLDGPGVEVIHYPGGEYQVRLTADYVVSLNNHFGSRRGAVVVLARIQNSDAVLKTALLLDAVNKIIPSPDIQLLLPYFPYGRADRPFTDGDCSGLEVFCRMVKTWPCRQVTTFDPHSDEILRLMGEKLTVIDPEPWIAKSVAAFRLETDCEKKPLTVLFPDEGAKRRYGALETINRIRIEHCEKERDPVTGRLVGFSVPSTLSGPTLIVDDICDGGATFLGVAAKVPTSVPLGLYVTHGIFSRGTREMTDRFKRVYCTNSFSKLPVVAGCIQWDAVSAIAGQ